MKHQTGRTGRMLRAEESIKDLGDAAIELERAREELASVAPELSALDRERLMVEPLSRLSLVGRFIESVLKRHGWEPAR